MGREKRVTVKIIANTALSYRINDEGDKEYPLYAQVTYDRKTTKFPVAGELWGTENEAVEFLNWGFPKDQVQTIGEFERDRNDNFSVRGFADIYKIHTADFLMTTEFYLMEVVDDEVQKIITVKQYKELSPNGFFDYKRGLEILGLKVTNEIREALEVRETLLKMRVDLRIYEWLIPGEKREDSIRIIEAKYDFGFRQIALLDKVALELIDSKSYTV